MSIQYSQPEPDSIKSMEEKLPLQEDKINLNKELEIDDLVESQHGRIYVPPTPPEPVI